MKNKLTLTFLFIAILLTTFPALEAMHQKVQSERAFHNSRTSPVIFIPGSSANQDRYDEVFPELNKFKIKHSVLKITVDENNKVHTTGSIAARDTQPFVVIAFQNNADGYTNIKKQIRWLHTAMNYLTQNYNFNNFSAVGHSNGGLIWTGYLEKYFDKNNLTINSLMTIGTPYNFLEEKISHRTAIFQNLYRSRSKLPRNLRVYSIAGTKNYQDDGIVPFESVEAGKYIFQHNVHKYTQITVTGDESEHSSLLSNNQVLQLIQENILDYKSNQKKM